VQVVTMEADMWWPALFGDANGRGGGVAQNANVAAMLVVSLASLLLPSRLGERFNAFSPYAMPLMIAAVLLSQSRAGAIVAAGYLLCFAVSAWRGSPRWWRPAFTVGLLAVLVGTVFLSPVLNPTPEQIKYREKNRDALALAHEKAGELPTAPLDTPLTLPERLEARRLIDGSAELRRKAFSFFLDVLKDHPRGLGTGFTNKFQTGPHNTFLKLAVDEGIFAAICLLTMLIAATWRALRMRSPALFSICITAWLASMFYHTVIVDPIIPAALAIGLGMIRTPLRQILNSRSFSSIDGKVIAARTASEI
jgi:O-antigen ligase